MKLWSDSFADGGPIPVEFTFCKIHPESHVEMSDNRSPHVAWSDLPPGTLSLALVCHDPDVPSRPDDVNQPGRSVPADLPRIDFYHWVLVDLHPRAGFLGAGAFSGGITPRGKSGPDAPHGTRQGLNDYTKWFAGDAQMAGDYFGYDGPCPPWNDEIVHHYHFTLYALDVERCPVEGTFEGPAVLAAIEGHVLGQASIVGTFTLNPAVGG